MMLQIMSWQVYINMTALVYSTPKIQYMHSLQHGWVYSNQLEVKPRAAIAYLPML